MLETSKLSSNLKYQTNEFSFMRPLGFFDQTFHVLTQTESGVSPFSLVIARSLIANHKSLDEVVGQLLQTMETNLFKFTLLKHEKEETVNGIPAHYIEYYWLKQEEKKPLKRVHQMQLIFIYQNEQGQSLAMQITATSDNEEFIPNAHKQIFKDFVASIELRFK